MDLKKYEYFRTDLGVLYNCNCLDIMPELEPVDLVLTDPPYEISNHGGGQTSMGKRKINKGHLDFVSKGFDLNFVFNEFLNICAIPNMIIFCSNKQISKTMGFFEEKKLSTTLLVWQKTNPIPFANGKFQEEIEFVVFVRGKGVYFKNDNIQDKKKVITMPTLSGKGRFHPTQKPTELIKKHIKRHTETNGIVLDPFLGSGTTAVACEKLGRKWIGIEISEKYCEIAAKRIEAETKQLRLF